MSGTDVAISAHFRHHGFTADKCDEAIQRPEKSGEGHPAGRLSRRDRGGR